MLLFTLLNTIKALDGKFTVLGYFFSLHIQNQTRPHKTDGSVYNVEPVIDILKVFF